MPDTQKPATPRRTAIVLVHGCGNQERYEFLQSFVSPFKKALDDAKHQADLYIDKVELSRGTSRTSGASDILISDQGPDSLFRPAELEIRGSSGPATVGFYEAYWADQDFTYTPWRKLKFNFWLLTTFWNPFFHLFSKDVDNSGSRWRRLRRIGIVLPFDIVAYHLAETALVLVSALFRRTAALSGFGRIIYDYAGDVKAYVSQSAIFHRQTKRDAIQARFDEVMIKASLENDEVFIVAHGLGTVVAYDCLHQREIAPSKMSEELLAWLAKNRPAGDTIDYFEKLRGFVTFGSPLDKMALFFPDWRPKSRITPFRIQRQAKGGRAAWTVSAGLDAGAGREFFWRNVYDVADPIGGKLELYSDANEQSSPENTVIASAWLPSGAHREVHRNGRVMAWLVARTLGLAERPIDEPAICQKVLRFLWSLALSAANVAFLSLVVFFLLDLAAGTLHDLIMDAESRIIFVQLDWAAGALKQWRTSVDVSGYGPLHMSLRGSFVALSVVAKLFLLALPFSLWFHLSSRRSRLWR